MGPWKQTRGRLVGAGLENPDPDDGLDRLFLPDRLDLPGEAWIASLTHQGARPDWAPELTGPAVCWREKSIEEWPEGAVIDSSDLHPTVEDRGVLDAFGGMVEGSAEDFRRFAERFGAPHLCSNHLLPLHHPPTHGAIAGDPEWPCGILRLPGNPTKPSTFVIPVELWRLYAREVQAALEVAAALHRNRTGSAEAWAMLMLGPSSVFRKHLVQRNPGPTWPSEDTPDERTLANRRDLFGCVLDGWLQLSAIRPAFRWPPNHKHPGIHLTGGGVHGAVVRQVAFVAANVNGLAVCNGCGRAYVPVKRRPSATRSSWCPTCGKAAADREAQRRRRARLKDEETAAPKRRTGEKVKNRKKG